MLFQPRTGSSLDLSEQVIALREDTDSSLWFCIPHANREHCPMELEESTYLGQISLLADVFHEGVISL